MTPAMCSTEFSPYFFVFGQEILASIDTMMVPPEHLPKTCEQHLKQTIENLRFARTLANENVSHNNERKKQCYYAHLMYREVCLLNCCRENGKVHIILWSVVRTTHTV